MKRYLQTLLVVTVFTKVKCQKQAVSTHRPVVIHKAVIHGTSFSLEKENLVIAVSWVDLEHKLMK